MNLRKLVPASADLRLLLRFFLLKKKKVFPLVEMFSREYIILAPKPQARELTILKPDRYPTGLLWP